MNADSFGKKAEYLKGSCKIACLRTKRFTTNFERIANKPQLALLKKKENANDKNHCESEDDVVQSKYCWCRIIPGL